MATEVKLPQWAMTLSEGSITEWKKQVGDTVAQGEALCEAEENKVTEDIESPVDGVVLKICVEEGDVIPVLSVICIVGEPGETV